MLCKRVLHGSEYLYAYRQHKICIRSGAYPFSDGLLFKNVWLQRQGQSLHWVWLKKSFFSQYGVKWFTILSTRPMWIFCLWVSHYVRKQGNFKRDNFRFSHKKYESTQKYCLNGLEVWWYGWWREPDALANSLFLRQQIHRSCS